MRLHDLRKGAAVTGDSGTPMDSMPVWMDMDKFNRGRRFFLDHVGIMLMALHVSLTTGFSIINLLQPLVFTGQSDTPIKALHRYLMTMVHLVTWHLDDVWQSPDGPAHRSLRAVRRMHGSVAKNMNVKQPAGNDVTADAETLHVSQYDMAIVQGGFMGALIMYPDAFGIKYTEQDLGDYVFFWRGIGYLLGIEDRFNMASGGYTEAKAITKEIEETILIPSLRDPPKDFDKMADAYIDGLQLGSSLPFALASKASAIAFAMDSMGRPVPALSLAESLRFWLLKAIMGAVRWIPGFERCFNALLMRMYRMGRQFMESKSSVLSNRVCN